MADRLGSGLHPQRPRSLLVIDPVNRPIESSYARLPHRGGLEPDAGLDQLTLRGLDRIPRRVSEWRELWDQAGSLDAAWAELVPNQWRLGA